VRGASCYAGDYDYIHIVHVDFCSCQGHPPHFEQLLEIGWWPATPDNPATAISIRSLKLFHAMNLFGRLPATDFYHAIEGMSNGEGLGGVDCNKDGTLIPVSS
jgi:hypothetical protein